MTSQIPSLHALYAELTDRRLPLAANFERDWYEWLKWEGHDAQALRDVIAQLQRGIREGTRNPGCLKFRNLIGCPDDFAQELAEARAFARNRVRPPRTIGGHAIPSPGGSPLGPSGLPPNKDEPRSTKEILDSQAFADLVKFKETLK